ncbi:DNA primase [Candidatus Wolfebacteria bacterium]|nr:DNA primase [Candidatus Wolfebacteria bacterium]
MTPIEQIKDKLDIVDFIKSYIELKPAGKNFKAPCPFHKEKTPSFIVSPDRQTWHCFGSCSEGGDIFKFAMKYENLEFYEALKILAEKAGVELKKVSPVDQKQFGVLYDINESAKNFFKSELVKNERAKEYLKSRGIKGETAKEFEIGMSPAGFDDLTVYLINQRYDIKDIERSGLNFKSEKGNYIDRFRNRIMFPIYNSFGKVIGFSGRILPEFDNGEMGKYINSPETPIFNKSRILYGFHKSKNAIREKKSALLVEGQMDFLMCWQDGIKNVVAASGTALTIEHLKILMKSADELIFSFDNDEAGLKAVERSIDLANNADFNVKILMLKDFKDPAEAVFKSPGAVANLIVSAKPAMGFYFDRYLSNLYLHKDIGKSKKDIRLVLMKIQNLASPIEQIHWLKELANKTKTSESSLIEELARLKIATTSRQEEQIIETPVEPRQTRKALIAERLLTLVLIKNSLCGQLKDYFDFLPDGYQMAYNHLIKKEKTDDVQTLNLMNIISMRSSLEAENLAEDAIIKEFQQLLKELKSEYFKERGNELELLIKEYEGKDDKKFNQAMEEFRELKSKHQDALK